MWYKFRQNNSHGYFHGPHFVLVEADGYEEANAMAEEVGVYFGGWGDCRCCGPRWYPADEYDGAEEECAIWPSEWMFHCHSLHEPLSFKIVTKKDDTGKLRVQDIETKSTKKYIPWEGV